LHAALADGLGALAEYGAKEGIHVLIENHGLHTSDADFIIGILKKVNNPYLGTLPDFGNWCLSAEWGSTGNNDCSQIYDPAKGVSKFLPYAKGVSAKSYRFDTDGFESVVDYRALLKLVKASGYNGYIGIEYEGSDLSEEAGIKATKALINKVWTSLD
jgi:sugar phosphate isomerase/epimerase